MTPSGAGLQYTCQRYWVPIIEHTVFSYRSQNTSMVLPVDLPKRPACRSWQPRPRAPGAAVSCAACACAAGSRPRAATWRWCRRRCWRRAARPSPSPIWTDNVNTFWISRLNYSCKLFTNNHWHLLKKMIFFLYRWHSILLMCLLLYIFYILCSITILHTYCTAATSHHGVYLSNILILF